MSAVVYLVVAAVSTFISPFDRRKISQNPLRYILYPHEVGNQIVEQV